VNKYNMSSYGLADNQMQKHSALRKALLPTLAVLFGGATFLYCLLWIYNNNWEPSVELGYDAEYVPKEHCQVVTKVEPDSPAEEAGLRPGDKIRNIAGEDLKSAHSLTDVYARHHPGDRVKMTVDCVAANATVVMTGVFRGHSSLSREGELAGQLGEGVGKTFPIVFLLVGLTVLFLRVEDRNAWLVALLFASFIAAPGLPNWFLGSSPPYRPFALAYRAIFSSLLGPLFYFFFAVFPVRSPLDCRASWLKWVGLGLGVLVAAPGLSTGERHAPLALVKIIGERSANTLELTFSYGFLALGFVALISNAARASTPEARRRIRVILFGTLVGVVPAAAQAAASDFFGFHISLFLSLVLILLLSLFPLSFAYAVVKHRVLEIPALLKRSARYLAVQRGFTVVLSLLSVGATVLFSRSCARYLHPMPQGAMPGGITIGALFGTVLLWTGTRVHKGVAGKIDRAFFRSAYDARLVLENLAHNTRKTRQRDQLAALLETEIREALQPSAIAVYLAGSDGRLQLMSSAPQSIFHPVVSHDRALLREIERRGEPLQIPPAQSEGSAELPIFGDVQPECLVPLLGSNATLTGVIVLGTRLSEEAYSREDKRLLASVSTQAGIALETIRLGEEIAEHIEAERRTSQEMDFAREVQSRLFPQKLPALGTLEYAARCIPTRQVGGDYYDFLELRPGRVALVLADIAGKGVSGALLMANLQANLRSQYAMALVDLPQFLRSVNQLFYENTADSGYATLFFADYDDSTRRLRYANCGHLAPLLLRADAGHGLPRQVERLDSTCTVVGLFSNWDGVVSEVQLRPRDTLLLYTDGITEATNDAGEEFGESRLIETLSAQAHLPVSSLLDALVTAVQSFTPTEQGDDITLVVSHCRS
jgi:sigma-B regulation protein RsbU (phosphoserine phosphatase)